MVKDGRKGRDMQMCGILMKNLTDFFKNDTEEVKEEDKEDLKRFFEGNLKAFNKSNIS